METRKNFGSLRETFKARSGWYRATTWIVLIQSVILMGLTIEASGVIFFMGDKVTKEASEIISSWMKQPVLTLLYEGPKEYKHELEEYFHRKGYLLGDGEKVYIFISKGEKIAWRVIYKDVDIDNFKSPSLDLTLLYQTLENLFEDQTLPDKSIAFDPITNQSYIVENQIYPFIIKHKKGSYKVEIEGKVYTFSEGFHTVEGQELYVGKDLKIEKKDNLLVGVFGVFGDYYYDGKQVIGKSFNIDFPEIPLYVDKGIVISRNFWYENGILQQNKIPVLDVFNGFVLYSDGSISDIHKLWRYEFDSVPFDWYYKDGIVSFAFLNGNVVLFDLTKRRKLFEGKYKKVLGVGFLKDALYIRTMDKIVKLDTRTGRILESYNENRDFILINDSIKFVDGIVLRPRYKNVWFDGIDYYFEDLKINGFKEVIAGNNYYYIILENGTWRIKK
ncbi:hypothetical protein [Thermosipho africanus]|nr:hypothetical protein [Thermosipho africanus]